MLDSWASEMLPPAEPSVAPPYSSDTAHAQGRSVARLHDRDGKALGSWPDDFRGLMAGMAQAAAVLGRGVPMDAAQTGLMAVREKKDLLKSDVVSRF